MVSTDFIPSCVYLKYNISASECGLSLHSCVGSISWYFSLGMILWTQEEKKTFVVLKFFWNLCFTSCLSLSHLFTTVTLVFRNFMRFSCTVRQFQTILRIRISFFGEYYVCLTQTVFISINWRMISFGENVAKDEISRKQKSNTMGSFFQRKSRLWITHLVFGHRLQSHFMKWKTMSIMTKISQTILKIEVDVLFILSLWSWKTITPLLQLGTGTDFNVRMTSFALYLIFPIFRPVIYRLWWASAEISV